MRRTILALYQTFLFAYVLSASADDAGSGHLQRAPEKTADQVKTGDQATTTPPAASATAAVAKPAPAKPAMKPTAVKPALAMAAPKAVAPPTPTSAARVPAGVPEGAVQTGPFNYQYTDKDGKVWEYSQTPFGWSRVEKADLDKQAVAHPAIAGADWKMTENGDEVRFEQPTPFGPHGWTKKKSEFTDEEKAVYERLKAK